MKKLILIPFLFSASVYADEFIQMSNGMTCWRNNAGFTYGCSGGVNTGDSGFNDMRTGRRYESNGNTSVDTRTGRSFTTPDYNNNDDYYDE